MQSNREEKNRRKSKVKKKDFEKTRMNKVRVTDNKKNWKDSNEPLRSSKGTVRAGSGKSGEYLRVRKLEREIGVLGQFKEWISWR